jgi:hypothetical protein
MNPKGGNPRNRFLRIGEAAALLDVCTDSLRQWDRTGVLRAQRTATGQRQYLREEVEAFARRRMARPSPPPTPEPPVLRTSVTSPMRSNGAQSFFPGPSGGSITPWEDEVAEARAEVEILKAHAEGEALRRADEAHAEAAAHRAKEEQAQRETEQRLRQLKSYGRSLAGNLPVEWKACVVALLEDFVTARQFPISLSDQEAYAIVQDRVRARLDRLRATEEQRRSREWTALLAHMDEARARQQVENLIRGGRSLALTMTQGWEHDDRERARRDIDRELRANVRSDWNEADVRDLVTDVLEEWEEDDEEDDQDGDWGEDDDNI